MTVEIGGWTKVPNKLFASGEAARLGPSPTVLYVALCEHANRSGKNTFKASDRAIAADTGLSPRTICDARKRLFERGLVKYVREKGQSYLYSLPIPDLNWVPIKQRLRVKRKARANHAAFQDARQDSATNGECCGQNPITEDTTSRQRSCTQSPVEPIFTHKSQDEAPARRHEAPETMQTMPPPPDEDW